MGRKRHGMGEKNRRCHSTAFQTEHMIPHGDASMPLTPLWLSCVYPAVFSDDCSRRMLPFGDQACRVQPLPAR